MAVRTGKAVGERTKGGNEKNKILRKRASKRKVAGKASDTKTQKEKRLGEFKVKK